MSGRYIVRLDDACPTMRTEVWAPLEQALDDLKIRPIVGVVPDNRDPRLACSPMDEGFWVRVRAWQRKDWAIAMHGLHHTYHPIPAGAPAILPLHDESEFAGLPLDEQKRRISEGYATMLAEGVSPRIFMAPSHTFDANTLVALRDVTGIRVIADGHALRAFDSSGFTWIPQQLWRFRLMPFGLWCICLHPNTMSDTSLKTFLGDLRRHADRFVDADAAVRESRERTMADYTFAAAYGIALRIKKGRGNG